MLPSIACGRASRSPSANAAEARLGRARQIAMPIRLQNRRVPAQGGVTIYIRTRLRDQTHHCVHARRHAVVSEPGGVLCCHVCGALGGRGDAAHLALKKSCLLVSQCMFLQPERPYSVGLCTCLQPSSFHRGLRHLMQKLSGTLSLSLFLHMFAACLSPQTKHCV